jgi:hypothetical protein
MKNTKNIYPVNIQEDEDGYSQYQAGTEQNHQLHPMVVLKTKHAALQNCRLTDLCFLQFNGGTHQLAGNHSPGAFITGSR